MLKNALKKMQVNLPYKGKYRDSRSLSLFFGGGDGGSLEPISPQLTLRTKWTLKGFTWVIHLTRDNSNKDITLNPY